MSDRNVKIIGNLVIVEEVQPKYFKNIIKWRNNPEFNKFLNQPYLLTMNLQQKWYANYIQDLTQGLFVVIDKSVNKPFGTIGYTDYDEVNKVLVSGRLLVGEVEYRGSEAWREAVQLVLNYYYEVLGVNIIYAHVVKENIVSIKWHEKWGYKENSGQIKFPDELFVNGMEQIELYRNMVCSINK